MLTLQLLHLAIIRGNMEVLRLLIERGADVNARNTEGRLPLHDCFELNHDDFTKILLDSGAVVDVCAAAAYGMNDRLREILARHPEDANDLRTGNSPLGWAAYGHQPESAKILLQHGAVVDRAPYDARAWGPAAMVASKEVARVLLEHGADPNWRDEGGNTPIHCVIRSRIVRDPAEFVRVLVEFGADLGLRNSDGRTALESSESVRGSESIHSDPFLAPQQLQPAESVQLRSCDFADAPHFVPGGLQPESHQRAVVQQRSPGHGLAQQRELGQYA
jgi:ankyrin repeat protein